MALTYIYYTGDGTTNEFLVPFDYIKKDYVKFYIDEQEVDSGEVTWDSDTQVSFADPPSSGSKILIKRETEIEEPLVDFRDGSTLTEDELDMETAQLLHLIQEGTDNSTGATKILTQTLPWLVDSVDDINADSEDGFYHIGSYPNPETSKYDASGYPVTATGSTTARTLQERFGDILNAKDYGAKGNGSVSDTLAIQAAIDAAYNAGGGTVFLPAGTYLIDVNGDASYDTSVWENGDAGNVGLVFRSNVYFVGCGEGSVLKARKNVSNYALPFLIDNNTSNLTIESCVFDGDDEDCATIRHGLFKSGNIENVFINKCKIKNVGSYGIGLQWDANTKASCKNKNVKISNCNIVNVGADGIDIKNCLNGEVDVLIENTRVSGFGKRSSLSDQVGIDCRGRVVVKNCTVEGAGDYASCGIRLRPQRTIDGVAQKDYAAKTLINGCFVDCNQKIQGIFITPGTNNIIANNIVVNFPSYGIHFASTSDNVIGAADTNELIIANCSAISSGAVVGFYMEAAAKLDISSCHAAGTQIGFLFGESINALASSLSCRDISTYNIDVRSTATVYLAGFRSVDFTGTTSCRVANTAKLRPMGAQEDLGQWFYLRSDQRIAWDGVGNAFITVTADGNNLLSSMALANAFIIDSGTNKNVRVNVDNTYALGWSSVRWSTVYAATGSINTSDERLKTNIETPDEALMRAWGKVNFKVFKFIDSVESKGSSSRVHVGVIAQEVAQAFASEGLDAGRYGLFCYDKWDDEYEDVEVLDADAVFDADGNEVSSQKKHIDHRLVQAAGDRYGIRYDEALALECAYQRWLGEQRDRRIAALESKLKELTDSI